MHTFQQLVQEFETQITTRNVFPERPNNLYEPCRYLIALKGKRVRPVACLMAAELFAPIPSCTWDAAIAIELFHNFTLIHDDIMDKAPLRRGFPTIHAKYGLTAGILGGDAMSIFAYQSLSNVENNFRKVLNLFNKTAIEVCEGQQMDMDFENRTNVTIEEYIEMIQLKTSVLLAASMEIGALTAFAPEEDCKWIYEFGKNLGIAFQLQDDYLDSFGNTEKIGKQIGGDILANKKTYLYLHALQNANSVQKEQLAQWLQKEDYVAQDKINAIKEIFTHTHADQACREAVNHYSQKSFESLMQLNVPEPKKEPLMLLAKELLNREQ